MKNSLFANKAELFKAAHKVTKVVLSFNADANYQVTFGQVLKAMSSYHMAEKAMRLKSELFSNSKMPASFQKSVEEITSKVYSATTKFDVECAASHVIKNIPQNIEKAFIESQNTADYYAAKGGVTMC
jgi:hypothetical protein